MPCTDMLEEEERDDQRQGHDERAGHHEGIGCTRLQIELPEPKRQVEETLIVEVNQRPHEIVPAP